MKADPRFLSQPKTFWANVRLISQNAGYTDRKTKTILIPTAPAIRHAFEVNGLNVNHLFGNDNHPTPQGAMLLEYFAYRSRILDTQVRLDLMDKKQAAALFKKLHAELNPRCPLPMNKQKGDKKTFAYLTCIVNILIERSIGAQPCDYDPRSLTTITRDGQPLRTLARRVDGAFPSAVNPTAIWEIKEYYSTKTFGSRVADGVYETLLDGLELEELAASAGVRVHHCLIVDDHFTWWECGRSYLCRIIDMLHMGYVDEVLFGRETVRRLPELARSWANEVNLRLAPPP